ncbi:anti-sigma factor domain-containing protein [Olsenella profusa]|uniref:Anti-sigma factor domain-containing protein n=1 Tax=Olsenella profusa TaxID=138595 RepID=A0ABS2F1D1_9ACTN|nr:anti-sigma factor domain-containing protein [Olsenella profusa]MBM6774349.1 anti-sigma factor domain-containing protein [Olsenella profusa]
MSYLIMECERSYAVVLDEEGRFLKVPNLGYEVGQTVEDVVVFDEGEVLPFAGETARRTRGRLVAALAAAACLCVLVVGGAVVWGAPVGTVRLRINPEVSMEVNRLDRVVSLTGENDDGVGLVEGLAFYGRTVDEVADDLAVRAGDEGYLLEGGTIEVSVESDDEGWKTATEDRLVVELEVSLDYAVTVTVPVAHVEPTGDASGDSTSPAPPAADDVPEAPVSVAPPGAGATETPTVAPVVEAPPAPPAPDDDDDDDGGGDDDDDDAGADDDSDD